MLFAATAHVLAIAHVDATRNRPLPLPFVIDQASEPGTIAYDYDEVTLSHAECSTNVMTQCERYIICADNAHDCEGGLCRGVHRWTLSQGLSTLRLLEKYRFYATPGRVCRGPARYASHHTAVATYKWPGLRVFAPGGGRGGRENGHGA